MGIDALSSKTFRASARLALAEPEVVVRCLCERFAEFGEVAVHDGKATIETGFGLAILEQTGGFLTLSAQSADETGLAFVKLSMAEHLLALEPCRDCPRLVWEGDGAAGTPLPYFREMTVIETRRLTPHMRRVTLQGENLARFACGGLHVRLLFPPPGAAPSWPVTGEDGRPRWPAGAARPAARIYTLRRIDPEKGEVEIDLVLHAGRNGEPYGPGARFAAHAKLGDRVGMTGPGGGEVPAADRLLLAGDETALPAIARILEELPPSAWATVLVEVAGPDEEQRLFSKAEVDLHWLHRGRAEAGTTTALEEAVRAVAWPSAGEGGLFAWVGCEARSFRAIRQFLRTERKLAREDHLAVAYWRRGASGDEARRGE